MKRDDLQAVMGAKVFILYDNKRCIACAFSLTQSCSQQLFLNGRKDYPAGLWHCIVCDDKKFLKK